MSTLSHRITTSYAVFPKFLHVTDMTTNNTHIFYGLAISLPEGVGLINLDKEGTTIPRNVGNYVKVYTA